MLNGDRTFDVRGACPGVSDPMTAADGMLLRLRLPGGAITPAQLRAVARVAERTGNNVIELTMRGSLQLRGVDRSAIGESAAILVANGLANPDASRDARRQVSASPLTGHDPTEHVDVTRLTGELARALADANNLGTLPPKFSVTIDAGGMASLRHLGADLAIGVVRRQEGRLWTQIEFGRALDSAGVRTAFVPFEAVKEIALGVARLCAIHKERMKRIVGEIGSARVMKDIRGDVPVEWTDQESRPKKCVGVGPIGVLPHLQKSRASLGCAPLLGRMTADTFNTIARLAERSGAGLRVTPWRGLIFTNVAHEDTEELAENLHHAGLNCDPLAPAHLVSACTGRPGCLSSRGDTLGAARQRIAEGRVTARIHLAGCEKRCGANGTPTTLIIDDDQASSGAPH